MYLPINYILHYLHSTFNVEFNINAIVCVFEKKILTLHRKIGSIRISWPYFADIKLINNTIHIMNRYETVFILTPVLSDEQMKEAVEKFKDVLKQNGANLINEELWGLRKLAYPIQKKSTGFYVLFEFEAEPTIVKRLEVAFRRDERVIRFLTFRLDKYAAEYAEKRRKLRAEKPQVEPAQAEAEATEAKEA